MEKDLLCFIVCGGGCFGVTFISVIFHHFGLVYYAVVIDSFGFY